MASRVLGVDIGAYSVVVAVGIPGLRKLNIENVVERVIPPGEEPLKQRAFGVLTDIFYQLNVEEDDAIYVVVSGDKLFIRVVDLDFKNLKRLQMRQAIGTELESTLPVDLEELVFAYEYIPKDTKPDKVDEVLDDDPTFVGEKRKGTVRGVIAERPEGTRLLAAAMLTEKAEDVLSSVEKCGEEPRGLIAFPAAHLRFAELLQETGRAKGAGHALALIDIGHRRIDVTIIQDKMAVYARTIGKGSGDLTKLIAKAWKMDEHEALAAKHKHGCIGSSRLLPQEDVEKQMHSVLEPEIKGWAKEIKLTLAACRAKCGAEVDQIVLHGGGSQLRGLPDYLRDKCGIDLTVAEESDDSMSTGLAKGVVIEGGSAKPSYNLRQGALAYKGNLSFLRQKAGWLAIGAMAVLLFAMVNAIMGFKKLKKSEAQLDEWLTEESRRTFQKTMTVSEVLEKVGPVEGKAASPIPELSAYELLLAFNDSLPKSDSVRIDVQEIDIKPGKITVEAITSPSGDETALSGIKSIEESLKKTECFKEFSSPESQPYKEDTRKFSLTIETSCND